MTEYLFKGLKQSVYDAQSLEAALQVELGLPTIDGVVVEREAIDARHKPEVYRVYNVRFTVRAPSKRLGQLLAQKRIIPYQKTRLPDAEPRLQAPERPIIIGFGPAGMFLGLFLARIGYRPLIFERGEPVQERAASVERLWRDGVLNPESNLQFGEGGAGTWSDGKLSTGKSSPLDTLILETLVEMGAPESILVSNKPHIGTDRLRQVVVNLRREIECLGGEVVFGQRLEDIHLQGNQVTGVTVSGRLYATSFVALAIGHSARDTMTMLHDRGVAMEVKPFAMGTRIEHPRAFIDETQYGREAAPLLPAADYKLSYTRGGTGVYSFCMCPGGQVVCAASEEAGQVSNGMSHYARDGDYSNSALVIGINPRELGLSDPLETIAYQRELEQKAFALGGGGYQAPAQKASDLLHDQMSSSLPETTYRPGVTSAMMSELLPGFMLSALQEGLTYFERRMPGFVDLGVLIGLESRTSSPVRVLRDEHCQSVSTAGLYLLGEGAGYAGGIMTCARDAVRFARLIAPRG